LSITEATDESGVVDLVEARCDVRLEHTHVVAVGRREIMDLSDGVLRSTQPSVRRSETNTTPALVDDR
jgi:hypothetical protein